MKKSLPISFLLVLSVFILQAQAVLYDFETPETSTTFQIFGGSFEGVLTTTIANPDQSGVNTSANVMQMGKAADAPDWGGAFSNPAPLEPVDATNGGEVCMDVWMDHLGLISLKLEITGPDDPDNYRQEVSNTVMNAWETICFDLTLNSLDGNGTPGTGKMFNNIVIFPDFGTAGTGTDVFYYFDNVTVPEPSNAVTCTTVFDFDNTLADFQYFGSSLDGSLTTVIPNPNASGINTSASVLSYVKGGDGLSWAGAFLTEPLATPIDGAFTQEICVKVHYENPGNLTLKLELDTSDDPNNWITTQEVTTVNEWTEVCFNFSDPSLEGNMVTPAGFVYSNLVIFPDFGEPGIGEDVNYYLDDFVVKTSNEASFYDVTFRVDMNEYAGSFNNVFVSGTFNEWSGTANMMDDSDGDGIYEATVNMEQGVIEYKFTLDDFAGEEMFSGLDDCTVTTIDGMNVFTNRTKVVIAEEVLPAVCFNSCYECGASIDITWNVNMSEQTVSADGVYLAGGPFFGHGDYPMLDPDGDQVYSITLEREIGFSSDYTFLNGLCPSDWSCKENIEGQDCAVEPFNDRNVTAEDQDVVINTCFGLCTTDGTCGDVNTDELIEDENLIEIYPNLTTDVVQIRFNEQTADQQIQIYDLTGKLQMNVVMNFTRNHTLDLTDFAAGIYLVRAQVGSKITTKRVVKQ